MIDEEQLRSLYERMSDDNSQTDDPIEAALLAEKNKEADYPSSVHVSQTSFQHKFAEDMDQLGIDVAVKSSNTQNKTNESGPKTQELNSLASKIAKQATKTLEQQNGMFDAKSKAEEKNLSQFADKSAREDKSLSTRTKKALNTPITKKPDSIFMDSVTIASGSCVNKRNKSVSIQVGDTSLALVTDKYKQKFDDQISNAFPLIKRDPKELLQEQLSELTQGSTAKLEKAKIATRELAFKRFIEETEKNVFKLHKFAVESKLQRSQFEEAEQISRQKMVNAVVKLGEEQHKQMLARQGRLEMARRQALLEPGIEGN